MAEDEGSIPSEVVEIIGRTGMTARKLSIR